MLGPIGLPETLFILVLALLIFGPRRLPELGRTVGKALGEFRRATTELKRSINTEIALEDDEPRPAAPRRPALAGASAPAVQGAVHGELPEGEEGGQAVWRPACHPMEVRPCGRCFSSTR
jgi:TatA/E family protein of Tat protein translocase